MHRTFIAAVVALAVAMTGGSAAPVRAAGSDDVARVLAGLAALAIIGAAIHESRKRNKQSVSRYYAPATPPPKHYKQHKSKPHKQYELEPRPLPPGLERRALLPRQCLRQFDTRHGETRMFGERCLQRSFRHAGSLPQVCARRVRTDRGPRYGYDPRCLRQQGYRIARD